MRIATVTAIAILAFSTSAHAKSKAPVPTGTLIDDVIGITPDGKGGLEPFTGLLIDAQGRITAVYKAGDKRLARAAYKVDGKKRFVVPGMIDAHAHVMDTGFAKLTLDLSAARSLDEALARITAYAAAHPDRAWIEGRGWNQANWGQDRMPTAAELDRATGGKPAYLTSLDGHAAWVNTAALAAAHVTEATADPAAGRIERAAGTRQPSGILIDSAAQLVRAKMPPPRPSDRDTAFGEAQLALLARGITAMADMGTTIEDWQVYRRAADAGNLRIRIVSYGQGNDAMALIAGSKPSPWLYDDRLKLQGVKLTLDGTLNSRGAWLSAPYADAPATSGIPTMNETQLGNLMSRAAIDTFQVAVHAIGDKANEALLDTIDHLSSTYKGDRRWRIEQAQVVAPADIARFGKFGVVASMQPQSQPFDRLMAEARLGPQRLAGMYAWQSIAATGATLAFGSNTPAQVPSPFMGIAAAISRQGTDGQPAGGWQPQERLTLGQALSAYTSGAAYAMFAEDRLGRIAPGMKADFLFVDRDLTTATPQAIAETKVMETWINGQQAWSAARGEAKATDKP